MDMGGDEEEEDEPRVPQPNGLHLPTNFAAFLAGKLLFQFIVFKVLCFQNSICTKSRE